MKLSEIFDSAPPIQWQTNGRFELGSISYHDFTYVVQVEHKPLHIVGLNGKRTAEVSFHRDLHDSELAHSTTGDIGQPFVLYGAVANGLLEKFKQYDAFYFIANHRHSESADQFESKRQIYFFLANRMAKLIGAKFYERSTPPDYEFIVSKLDLPSASGYVIEAVEALKAFKLSYIKC
jgi:hypothetical protein